jgi:hypothetical protein
MKLVRAIVTSCPRQFVSKGGRHQSWSIATIHAMNDPGQCASDSLRRKNAIANRILSLFIQQALTAFRGRCVMKGRAMGPGGFGESLRRLLDERGEQRRAGSSQTAVLGIRGANHVVRVLDLSASGAMVQFAAEAQEGEPVSIQLLDHGLVHGQVRWSHENRVGIQFVAPLSERKEQD